MCSTSQNALTMYKLATIASMHRGPGDTERPCTEDLVTLKENLDKSIEIGVKCIRLTYEEYVKLAHIVMARILIFNKRRSAEVDELKITDYDNRIRGTHLSENAEIVASLELPEKILVKRYSVYKKYFIVLLVFYM